MGNKETRSRILDFIKNKKKPRKKKPVLKDDADTPLLIGEKGRKQRVERANEIKKNRNKSNFYKINIH